MLTGTSPSDCLLLELAHWGHPEDGYQRGLSDVVVSQGLQLLTLLSYATTVEMAYEVLTSSSDQMSLYLQFNQTYSTLI